MLPQVRNFARNSSSMESDYCFLPDDTSMDGMVQAATALWFSENDDCDDAVDSDADETTALMWAKREKAKEKVVQKKHIKKSSSKSPDVSKDFAVVEFPPRMPASINFEGLQEVIASRSKPLRAEELRDMMDQDGRLVNEHQLRQAVFRGGVEPGLRQQVWQFLFELYPFHSTARERDVLLADHYVKYRALKSRWKKVLKEDPVGEKLLEPAYLDGIEKASCETDTILTSCPASPDVHPTSTPGLPSGQSPHVQQQLAFMEIQAQVYAGRQSIHMESLAPAIRVIDKDVPRTDRDTTFFHGLHNPNLQVLRDILITFAAYHHDVTYAQGMNDLLSLFLEVLGSEVEAYWCFTKYMERMEKDFLEDGSIQKLSVVRELLVELDPDLWHYMDQLGLGDMTFCHRWLLLSFKREFPRSASLKCFEVLSSLHLELSSMQAERIRTRERRKDFLNMEGKNRLEDIPVNKEYTFTVFMCITILVENRHALFQCQDTADVIELICGLTQKMDLDEILAKSELLFSRYCQKSVSDCFQILEPWTTAS